MTVINFERYADDLSIQEHVMKAWADNCGVTSNDLQFALQNFELTFNRKLILDSLKPEAYFLQCPELNKHVQRIGVDVIQSLPDNLFNAHLAQLERADAIENKGYEGPCKPNYNAELFSAYRKASTASDVQFIKSLYTLDIDSERYTKARKRLTSMA